MESREQFIFLFAASATEATQTEYRIDVVLPTGEAQFQVPFRLSLEPPCAPKGNLRFGQDINERIIKHVALQCTPKEGHQVDISLVQNGPIASHSVRISGKVTFLDAQGAEISWGYVNGQFSGEDRPWDRKPTATLYIDGLGLPRDQIAAKATAIILRSSCREIAANLYPYETDWWCGEVVIDMLR